MDDILVFNRTLEQHRALLAQVLQLLWQNQFYVKRSKCSFAQQNISYLGYYVSKDGVSTDKSKIQMVQDSPVPHIVKKLRGFLGIAGYYRKFVRNFGVISKPLTDLLKKNTLFLWTPTANAVFNALKQALVQAPVLAPPDFSQQFVLQTYASGTGIGAVLMQNSHPIACLSKALSPRNLGVSAYEKECLDLLLDVDRWTPYLQHT